MARAANRSRRRASAVDLSLPELLNEVQRGAASAHLRYAKMLWEWATADAEGTLGQLLTAMKWFATVAEPTQHQSRLLSFFGTFANEALVLARVKRGEEERVDEVRTRDRGNFVEALLAPLIELSYAKDHTVRWRVCQLLHALVGNLSPLVEPSDEIIEAFQDAMLDRLDDAKPTIRAAAVRALARLPDPGDSGDFSDCELTKAFVDMLAAEKSKVVRKAVLASLPGSDFTLRFYIERTRDEADDVRKMAYLAIAERIELSAMRTEDAALLVRRGLTDRTASVREAVAAKLVLKWLEQYGGEPVPLVQALGVQEHPEECELVLKTLLEQGEINAVRLAELAQSDSIGLRADFSAPEVLMSPASALFWRMVCESLAAQATSKGLSAAGKVGAGANIDTGAAQAQNDALEAALPPTVADMADIIAKHARAGAAYRFSTGQLMQLAAKCLDFADAAGRSAASLMLHTLLTDVPSGSDKAELAAWEAAWHSEAWLRALALFLRKVYGSPAELADAMLDVVGTLHRQCGWADGNEVPEQAWVHTLSVAGLLLEQLPTARPALAARSEFGLRDLLELVKRGLRHPSAKVRREAVRCLGLYCFLEGIPTSPTEHLHDLRQFLINSGESSAIRAVAAQALGDIAVAHGIKEVDRCLAAALVDGLVPGLDPELQQKPLAEMMLDVLRQWVDDFAVKAAEAAGARKKSRRSRSGEGLEAAGELGAAVVESLARLVRSHLPWQRRELVEVRELAMEDVDVVKVLVELVLLYFNPDIEAATLVSQALPVFFQNYAELDSEHQQYLATAFLPAARLAAADDKMSGKRLTVANCISAKVMGFMAQLLMTPYGPPGKQEAVGHEMLVDILLRELLASRRQDAPKPFLAALCRVVAALEVLPVGEAEGGASARMLLEMARQAMTLPRVDAAMRKDLSTLQDKLHARARQHALDARPFEPEEISQLEEEIQNPPEGTILDDYPRPFDELPEPVLLGAGGRVGKTPAKTPARGGRRGKAKNSSESEDEGSRGGPQMPPSSDDEEEAEERTPARVPPTASRRMPDRAARSARKPVVDAATSSSSEEEGEGDSEQEQGEEGDEDALSELAENMSPAVRRPRKARRQSSDSVSALRQALQENRIS